MVTPLTWPPINMAATFFVHCSVSTLCTVAVVCNVSIVNKVSPVNRA